MRKAFVAFVLLFALSMGGVCAAFAGINAQKDQVTFTQSTVFGDEAAAHGLTVDFNTTYDQHLFWETTHIIGTESKTDTEFDFSAKSRRDTRPGSYVGLNIWTQDELGYFVSEADYGFGPVYKALQESVGPGESKTQILKMNDYFEFYPFEFNVDVPSVNIYMNHFDLSQCDPATIVPGTEEYVTYKLQEFFKIPVPDSHKIYLKYEKDTNGGGSHGSAGSTDGSENFYMNTVRALTDEACYLTFYPYTNKENLVDLSHIPGGFGIYRLPYEEELLNEEGQKICPVKVDELAMVYPLDPALDLREMTVSPDQSKLLLHTMEEGTYVVTVIDLATMDTLQKIEVVELHNDYNHLWIYQGDDFFVTTLNGGQHYAVLTQNDRGEYEVALLTEYLQDSPIALQSNLCSMDFDGRRLAITMPLRLDSGSHRWDSPDFYLAVFDGSEFAYYGEYRSSLNAGQPGAEYRYPVRAMTFSPITIHWTDGNPS